MSSTTCVRGAAVRGAAAIAAVALVAATSAGAAAGRVGTAAVTPTAAAACVVGADLVNPCRPWFGTSANGYPQTTGYKQDQMLYAEQRMGRQMDVAHTYHVVGDDQLSTADVSFATRPDTLLLTNWLLTRDWASADGSDPAVNERIDTMAESIKALGDTRILLDLHHEPENDVSSTDACPGVTLKGTSGTPEQYRAMWANVRSRFDAAGVSNVVWVMNYMSWAPYACMLDALYPGDDLVDWILFNGYSHGESGASFEQAVGVVYDYLSTHSGPGHDYLSKPWGLAEWGINLSTQGRAYAYYDQARTALEAGTFPRLKLYSTFDAGDPHTGDASYRVAYGTDGLFDQAEQDAFNAFANSPVLTGAWRYPDITPPSAVGSLSAQRISRTAVRLRWTAATDDVGVDRYEVFRGATRVARLGATASTFKVGRLKPGVRYTFSVRAVDAAGNVGPFTSVQG